MRRFSLSFSCLALGLAGWACYLSFAPQGDRGGLVLENADCNLGEWPVGESVVNLRVSNTSTRPGRVVGFAFG